MKSDAYVQIDRGEELREKLEYVHRAVEAARKSRLASWDRIDAERRAEYAALSWWVKLFNGPPLDSQFYYRPPFEESLNTVERLIAAVDAFPDRPILLAASDIELLWGWLE